MIAERRDVWAAASACGCSDASSVAEVRSQEEERCGGEVTDHEERSLGSSLDGTVAVAAAGFSGRSLVARFHSGHLWVSGPVRWR